MTSPASNRRRRLRRLGIVVLGAFAAGLLLLHLWYPLPYVYRVFVYQDADYEDMHRFPARTIAAAATARELPVALDSRVADVLEEHPEIEDFEAFLEATETTAFLVVHEGNLIEERYLRGDDRESMQNTFSVSKSMLSALVGLAVRDGALELEAPITRYLPELAERDGGFEAITLEHLLDMRSGIRYSSEVAFPIVNQDDPLIYYFPDVEALVLERTVIESVPGDFEYNNYNPALLGLALRRATGVPVGEFLERELWQPMGAEGAAGWTTDDRGFERMESGFHARGRDLARFGLLYLRRGRVEGLPLVPEDWVRRTTALADREALDRYDGRRWWYRTGWWVVPRAEGPSDFCAIGRFGQFVYVSPTHEAVFVRTGPGRGEWGDRDWTSLFHFAAARL